MPIRSLVLTDNNATLTIHRAAEISITADGQTKTVWLTEGTAADALNAAELTVNDDDLLNVALTEPVCDRDEHHDKPRNLPHR